MRKNYLFSIIVLLCTLMSVSQAKADDYADYLTAANGFTEVTTVDGLKSGSNYYYVFQSVEDPTLVLANGRHAAKPDWASDGSWSLHYKNFAGMPLTDLNMYYQLEYTASYTNVEGETTYTGSGFGMKSAVNTSNFFQTHGNAGWMWVNTFTDAQVDVWDAFTPTYANGSWTFYVNRFDGEDYWFNDGGTSNYLGAWDNGQVIEGAAIAANKSAEFASHFKIYRILKTDFATLKTTLGYKPLNSATSSNPIDATYLITNPSFETGDTSGWTTVAHNNGSVMPETNYNDVGARNYGFSNHDGQYTYNFYTWWAEDATVSQNVSLPAGIYDVSATVGAWEGRTVTFNANSESQTATGQGDGTGVVVTFPGLTVGNNNQLAISATSTIAWWEDTDPYKDTQNFFKLDNVRLTCKGVYLAGIALPLPNDNSTLLVPGQWYYYEAAELGNYQLSGALDNIVYTQNGTQIVGEGITYKQPQQSLTLNAGRVYFMTTASDATLTVTPLNGEGATNDFSICTLNVDGLPQSISIVTVNEDGPGSDGTRQISQYLANKAYDLIAVQEDFNFDTELRSALTNYDHGTHRAEITASAYFSPPADTDGLNFFWNTTKGRLASGESWTQFNHSESGDGNQYIKKGWRYYEVTLADGMKIDVYMTHMDAGDVVSSRNIQWTELANAVISNENINRPKIILGDFNSRFTREAIRANFFTPVEATGHYTVSDAWVEKTRSGNYPSIGNDAPGEVVDKIIYLNPTATGAVTLTLNSYVRESDYSWGDHNPVVATFTAREPAVTITPALDRWTWKGETRATTNQKWYLYNVQYGTTDAKTGFLSRNNNPRLVSDPNAAGVYPFKFSTASGNATLTSVTENSTYKLVGGNPPTYSTSGTATTFTISEATAAIAGTTDKAYHISYDETGFFSTTTYYVGINTNNSNNFQRQTNKSASNAWALISTEQVAMYNRFVLASQKATYYAGYLPIDESVKAQMVTLLAKTGVTWTDGTTELLEALNEEIEEWFDDDMTYTLTSTTAKTQTVSGLPEGFYKVKATVTSSNKKTVTVQMGSMTQETPMTGSSAVTVELPLYYHSGEGNVDLAVSTKDNSSFTLSNLQLVRYDSYYDETITSAEYATTAIRYNTDIPAGVQVLYVTGKNDFNTPDAAITGSILLGKYNGTILPAGEGVILYKGGLTANKQFRFYRTKDAVSEIGGNMLHGAVNRIEAGQKEAGTYYMLARKNIDDVPTVGFFELAQNTAIKAHKAYLLFDNSSGVKGYLFSFEEEETPTAIKQIETDAEATVVGIYSLGSARQSQLQRGMNIIRMSDGSVKKVLVK